MFETALGETDADNAIDLLRASFARRRHTLAWLVEERSTPGDLGARLQRAGFRHAYDWLAMARDLSVHPPRPRGIPRGVGLIRVGAAQALWNWVDVTAEAFGIHPSMVNQKYAAFARFIEAAPQAVTPWILTSGRTAVAALLTYDDGENIGLYWVGTRKRFRRRGLGAMLIELALAAHEQTKGPRRFCVLHAGTDVERFYAALGFAVTHPLQVYVLSPT